MGEVTSGSHDAADTRGWIRVAFIVCLRVSDAGQGVRFQSLGPVSPGAAATGEESDIRRRRQLLLVGCNRKL